MYYTGFLFWAKARLMAVAPTPGLKAGVINTGFLFWAKARLMAVAPAPGLNAGVMDNPKGPEGYIDPVHSVLCVILRDLCGETRRTSIIGSR
jgi:hypothetical protein